MNGPADISIAYTSPMAMNNLTTQRSDSNNSTLHKIVTQDKTDKKAIKTLRGSSSLIKTFNQSIYAVILSASICNYASPSLAYGDSNGFYNPYVSRYSIPIQSQYAMNYQLNQFVPQIQWLPSNYPASFLSFSSIRDSNTAESIPSLGGWASNTNGASANQQDSLDFHIKNILVPRVSGTPGNVKVRQYIADQLSANNYHVSYDEFTDDTPIGQVSFSNIIATSNPRACRQLVLACHYDSKMMAGFLGATDSAVPCAMILKIAESFNSSYRQASANEDPEKSLALTFIFFDGEEAYHQWGPKDSLYGSRHLAERWAKQQPPSQCKSLKNELQRIELLTVLDLIGTADASFIQYSYQVSKHYRNLQKYEKTYLSAKGLSSSQSRRATAFKNTYIPLRFVEDDHVPFHVRGVPILSLLAHPFPSVWHTIDDNYSAIDFSRTRQILHVIEEFVSNYKKVDEIQ